MKKVPLIGILAGMGPKSTGPFIDQVVSTFQDLTGAKNDIEFPPMMIYSLPTPFYIDHPIDHTLMEKTICEGLKKLKSCDVDFIAMPCNTAHLYYSRLKQCIKIPLLNIVEATLNSLPKSAKKITILATRATIEANIYQKELDRFHLSYVLDPSWQKIIDDLILNIKKCSHLEKALKLWEDLCNEFRKAQIDTLIIACTDLNVILTWEDTTFQIVDSSKCLAKAIVNKWTQLNSLIP